MRKVLLPLGSFFLICATGLSVYAQQNQPAAAPTAETDRPKNEVERLLNEAKARGEVILATCIQDCLGDAAKADGQKLDIEPGKVVELPKSNYPPIARAAHVSGTVEVQVIIGLDGNVIAAAAISGHPLLRASALSAARQTRFTPPKLKGQPVKVVGVLQYNFVPL